METQLLERALQSLAASTAAMQAHTHLLMALTLGGGVLMVLGVIYIAGINREIARLAAEVLRRTPAQ